MKKLLYLLPILSFIACEDDAPLIEECTPQSIRLSINSISATPCGFAEGSVTLSANSNLRGRLSYSLDSINFQDSPVFDQLAAGTYRVIAQSEGGCSSAIEVEIPAQNTLELEVSEISDAGCDGNAGSFRLTASLPGYEFSIDSLNYQSSATFSGLTPGVYTLTARNDAGCGTTEEVRIPSGISFANHIENIINTRCALSGCHAADSPHPVKLSSLAEIQERADRVRARAVARTMPPGAGIPLTDEEIALIRCWVDDGALNN